MPTMTPDSNEERANIVEPTATSLDPRPGLKRKAAMANLDDLELNLKIHCQDRLGDSTHGMIAWCNKKWASYASHAIYCFWQWLAFLAFVLPCFAIWI